MYQPHFALSPFSVVMGTPHLNAGAAHVWILRVGQRPVPGNLHRRTTIVGSARRRMQQITSGLRRREFVAGRLWLMQLLAHYSGQSQNSLRINTDSQGKPLCNVRIENDPLHFSISHSGGYVAICVARGSAVGCDLQTAGHVERASQVLLRVLGVSGPGAVTSTRKLSPDEFFCSLWVRHEAVCKLVGRSALAHTDRSGGHHEESQKLQLLSRGWVKWHNCCVTGISAPKGMHAAVASDNPIVVTVIRVLLGAARLSRE